MTINQEYTLNFWQNSLTTNIYSQGFPLIMTILRKVGRLVAGTDSFPVFLTITDITPSAGRNTNVPRAAQFLRSKGCRPLFRSRFILVIFHVLAEILYEANIAEQENWEPGVYSLATLNYGSLISTASLQDIFFNDPHFGNHRADLLASVNKAESNYPDQRYKM